MGRKRKYNTKEEKRIAVNEQAMSYYERNKENVKRKNRERYHRKKMEKLDDNKKV